MIKNKKQMFLVISIFALILFLGGTTYAWFNYRSETSEQEVIAGDIYLHLNEGQEEIELSNIFPETPEEARARNDNYITFDIDGVNTSNKDIYYEFILDHGTDKASPKTRYRDQDLRFDLIEINGNNEIYLLSNVGYGSLVNQRIYVNTVDSNTSVEIERHYKLRMWLSDEVIISDTDPNATYNTTDYTNKYATIKLIVVGDFQEKEAPKQAYQLIQSLASTKSYVASYQDLITSNQNYSSYTTQDTVGVNNNKQIVYYYTGEEASSADNVLFGGYCWQIIRTTDNGGVKLLYNGIAEKGIKIIGDVMTDNDITYTNDSTYAYTYDSNTKKWTSTSAGIANTTDTFIFSVKNVGDYAINYKISSELFYDLVKIYKNDTLIKEDSGFNDSNIELGSLTSLDEIKIEYIKGDFTNKGNDNIEFEIIYETDSEESNFQCQRSRGNSKGINGQDGISQDMNSVSLYGRSYDYNLTTGEFIIEDSTGLPTSWSMSDANNNGIDDYQELIGTYTCLSSSSKCNTLYYVGGKDFSNTSNAYVASYTIGDIDHYSQVGKSAFNTNYRSPSFVGYMFNKEYNNILQLKSGEYYSTAIWNSTDSVYELESGNGALKPDTTHHYICDSDCSKVRYYYYGSSSIYYYILLENGETIEDVLYKMIGFGSPETKAKTINANYSLNKYNSAMKGYLENWYKKNLEEYGDYIDQSAVFCNNRSVVGLGGWNSIGTSLVNSLTFFHGLTDIDLNCANITDRFSLSNEEAKLAYPIGLLTQSEYNFMGKIFLITNQRYYSLSSHHYDSRYARVLFINESGENNISTSLDHSYGVRPAITLKSGVLIESGEGTYTNPYIVGPIVDRNN